MRVKIKEFLERNKGSASYFSIWEACKAYIRGEIISYKANVSKLRKNTVMNLQRDLDQAVQRYITDDSQASKSTVDKARQDLKDYFDSQTIINQNTRFQKLYEESEHAGKCLAWSIKKKSNNAIIKSIYDNNRNQLVDQGADMDAVFLSHYKTLYSCSSPPSSVSIEEFLSVIDIPKLNRDLQAHIVARITIDEIQGAIKGSLNGKACGCDGFPAEFYKVFMPQLENILTQLFNAILEGLQVPLTFSEAAIVSVGLGL